MESSKNGDYGQLADNSQDEGSQNSNSQSRGIPKSEKESIQLGGSDNRNVGNDENSTDSNYNPPVSNSVPGNDAESFTATNQYSEQNSDFKHGAENNNEDEVPDSDDIDEEDGSDAADGQNSTPQL